METNTTLVSRKIPATCSVRGRGVGYAIQAAAIRAALTLTFAGLLGLGALIASSPNAWSAAQAVEQTVKVPVVENPLGDRHLTFLGPLTEEQAKNVKTAGDTCLIRLNRRMLAGHGRSPRDFYMLAKRVNPLEGEMLADALDGEWNTCDQFRAALLAEGTRTPQMVADYEGRLDRIVREIENRVAANAAPGDEDAAASLTKTIFQYLHENVFTAGYNIDCTDPAGVLETGEYNCVSATVIFNSVAERLGLDACGLEMPGHALSRVKYATPTGFESMDLETTCPNWFSLGDSTARRAATLSKTASAARSIDDVQAVRAANTVEDVAQLTDLSKKLREITPVQLIATIYYNQGVDYLNRKDYPQAAAANLKALYLDPQSETAWGNLMATINNWSIDCATAGRFDMAAILLDYGVSMDETYDKFRINQRHIYYHWIRSLAREGRAEDAMLVYKHAGQRLPDDPSLKELVEKEVVPASNDR
ncbi:MAG TPA: hypothetical protein DEB39_08620 [Planctomycetaceae bacterium]|nr:hypothetical protein [Planctomycetaceae bacterium]